VIREYVFLESSMLMKTRFAAVVTSLLFLGVAATAGLAPQMARAQSSSSANTAVPAATMPAAHDDSGASSLPPPQVATT
jgi:hypothetical protein